jgi:hypothetical protein
MWKESIKYDDDDNNKNIINNKREAATITQSVEWLYCLLNSLRFESAVPVLRNTQTGSGDHPASYSLSTGEFPGVYSGRGGAGHTLTSAEVKNWWSYTSSSPICLYVVYKKSYNFTFLLPCRVMDFFLNNQQDALIIQIYSVIKLYMFRASSLPIIRSFLLDIRHW